MSNRNQIDSVIDDDDEFCPLCIEEFDLSDKNFKPCPCGYQICQFCYNNIKTHSEEGRCPNCRRVYDESTIQYKVPDVDEFKADLALKHRKAAAAKKKEAEKREIEASSRKNLAGVRVVQKNLVYVIGLNPTIRDEGQLLQTLRGPEYFGQYGEIDKIVVSKAKPGGNPNQGIGVYVTFSRKVDAASCIAAVDGSTNGDRLLRAQYGTTKYCSSFLRNEQCNNRNCTFLHETGDDNESYSRQDLSSMNTAQRPHYTNGATNAGTRPFTQPLQSQPMRRQGSKDEGAKPLPDGPALPSSASWANKDAPFNRARRLSAGSRSSPSPKPVNVPLAKTEELKKNFPTAQESRRSTPAPTPAPAPVSTPAPAPAPAPVAHPTPAPSQGLPPAKQATASAPVKDSLLESLLNAVNSPGFRFVFSTDGLSDDDLKYIENGPSLIDPYGGAKRRAMREKVEQERAKQEAETQSLLQSAAADDENRESGSLQLGGEPDDVHPSRNTVSRNRDTHGAIQPPSQQTTNANSLVGSPVSISQQFHNLNTNSRSLTPLQQQQLMLLKSGAGQQGGLVDSLNPAFDQASQSRSGLFQGGISQAGTSNTRLFGQQNLMQTGNPGQLAAPAPQQGQFYTSSVQGPPPGLKTAGTPPISGGGMFAQGHGFTSNTNLGLGSNVGKQEANPDLMRELLRGRGVSAGTGGLQGHESAKREFLLPFIQQHHTPPPLTPATGLLNAFYGSQNGALADFGPQKQKKKGKKHRHANTSSGGGGVVDLADPSILQARMHQVGVGSTGQVLYGSQGQVDDEEFPPLSAGPKSRLEHAFRPTFAQESREHSRAGTPSLPPGLPLPHGHPPAAFFSDKKSLESPEFPFSLPTHGPPGLPASGRATPLQKSLDTISRRQTPTVADVSDENAQVEKIRNFGDISLGSPKARSARKPNAAAPTDLPASTKSTVTKSSQSKKPKPIKLDLSMPLEEVPTASPVKESPVSSNVIPANLPQSNVATNSRPGTPLTGVSRNSDSSGPRQPRVLRVVDTPKTETPPPPSAAPSLSSVVQAKIRSRRPSISSADHPETPGDIGSDFEFTSASASRANSPPPSKIGSAPVRAMTKNQAKKERRMKAKQAEEAIKEEVATAIPEEPVQAPIIGRKRKTKKPPTASEAAASTSTKDPSDAENVPAPKVEAKADVSAQKSKPSPEKVPDVSKPALEAEVVEPPADEPWRANNTIAQLIEDAKATGTSIKDLFLERTAPLHVLLAQMQSKGDIDLNNHSLFNPPPLNQRTDMKCEAEDYEFFKLPLYISEENKKILLSGQPLRINHGVDNLKVRCMITPKGRVLRHLSDEEEDRYLELESQVDDSTWNEYPSTTVPGLDVTNMNGGLDALFLTPGRFGVALSEPPSPRMSLAAGGAVVTAEDQFALDPPSESGPTMGETDHTHKLPESARYPPIIPEMDNVFGMSNKELRTFIEQSQRELETSRKEFDAVDKKLAALVKRNKKLAQQALSSVVEVGK